MKPFAASLVVLSCMAGIGFAQNRFDLLLTGGHVIDAKNGISAVRDVGIKDGAIAAVAAHLDPATALKVVNVSGLYVTPGLVDIHVHVFAGTGERNSYAGDNSLYPDGYTFRVGVTTVADAGCSGWRNFEEFKDHIIDRSKTRVLAFLNIVGHGMRGGRFENDLKDMEAAPGRGDGQEVQGPHRGLQDRPLRRTGMDAGGACRRGRQPGRRHSGDGGFRHRPSGAAHPGPADQEASPRRHLHALLLRPAARTRRLPAM